MGLVAMVRVWPHASRLLLAEDDTQPSAWRPLPDISRLRCFVFLVRLHKCKCFVNLRHGKWRVLFTWFCAALFL